jgi:dedicator of cytokinesis protein 3
MNQFIHYAHLLADQHANSRNFAEAAFTLLLHSDLLQWTSKLLPEEGDFPTQTESQRKVKKFLKRNPEKYLLFFRLLLLTYFHLLWLDY